MARIRKLKTVRQKKKELIKKGGKILTRANRAWKKGNMSEADRLQKRFFTIEKRIKRL